MAQQNIGQPPALRLCPECAGRAWLFAEGGIVPSQEQDVIEAGRAVDDFVAGLGLPEGILTERDKAMWVHGYRMGLMAERRRSSLRNSTVLMGMI